MTTATVSRLVRAQQAVEGDGFVVRRPFPTPSLSYLDPFLLFDHMGPAEFGPEQGVNVRPHPHIGLATVTYLFDGAFMHRDSLGTAQVIRPGDVNWMVAGRGIVHSERTPPEVRDADGHWALGYTGTIAFLIIQFCYFPALFIAIHAVHA